MEVGCLHLVFGFLCVSTFSREEVWGECVCVGEELQEV